LFRLLVKLFGYLISHVTFMRETLLIRLYVPYPPSLPPFPEGLILGNVGQYHRSTGESADGERSLPPTPKKKKKKKKKNKRRERHAREHHRWLAASVSGRGGGGRGMEGSSSSERLDHIAEMELDDSLDGDDP